MKNLALGMVAALPRAWRRAPETPLPERDRRLRRVDLRGRPNHEPKLRYGERHIELKLDGHGRI